MIMRLVRKNRIYQTFKAVVTHFRRDNNKRKQTFSAAITEFILLKTAAAN